MNIQNFWYAGLEGIKGISFDMEDVIEWSESSDEVDIGTSCSTEDQWELEAEDIGKTVLIWRIDSFLQISGWMSVIIYL